MGLEPAETVTMVALMAYLIEFLHLEAERKDIIRTQVQPQLHPVQMDRQTPHLQDLLMEILDLPDQMMRQLEPTPHQVHHLHQAVVVVQEVKVEAHHRLVAVVVAVDQLEEAVDNLN